MRVLVAGFFALVAVKYLTAHHVHMGVGSCLLLWWVLSLLFPRHVHNPVRLIKRHWRLILHKRLRFPLVGGMVSLAIPFPIALPILAGVWLYAWIRRKEEQHVKGQHPQLGRRFTRGFPPAWERAADQARQYIRLMVVLATVCRSIILRSTQPLRNYYHRWRNQPPRAGVRGDGDGEDKLPEVQDQSTD